MRSKSDSCMVLYRRAIASILICITYLVLLYKLHQIALIFWGDRGRWWLLHGSSGCGSKETLGTVDKLPRLAAQVRTYLANCADSQEKEQIFMRRRATWQALLCLCGKRMQADNEYSHYMYIWARPRLPPPQRYPPPPCGLWWGHTCVHT